MNSNPFQLQLEKLKDLTPVVKIVNTPETTALFRFLVERITNPDSYVVLLGETSSGKSSIINGIIGAQILPVSARPSTGAISEIAFSDNVSEIEYYECTKDASLIGLTAQQFEKLTWTPNKSTSRLRVVIPSRNFNPGLRLFDTPGYNSIVEEHEEVLRDFLPNADAVIYTVSYRIGIQNEDFTFLRFLRELIGEDVPIIVTINRCPQGIDSNNKRIKEISKYVTDIIGRKPEIFLIPIVTAEKEGDPILPKNDAMWRYVTSSLNSTARRDKLAEAFDGFIEDLFNKCYYIIKMRLAKSLMSEKESKEIIELQRQYADRLRSAVTDLINPTFSKIISGVPKRINEVYNETKEVIFKDIDSSSRLDMEEEVAYINGFLMPFTIQSKSKDIIQRYLDVELTDLNDRLDDFIQKETIKFNDKVAIQLKTCTDVAVSNLLSKGIAKLGSNGLTSYVIQFGGAGGANAGFANAASHLLKKTGDFFGKTFSRTAHNNLKHFLSKIGATSAKKVGGAIAVIAELLVFAVEVSVWKSKARSKIEKALNKWKEETLPEIKLDLEKLRRQNNDTIMEIANDQEHSFDDEFTADGNDISRLRKEVETAESWQKKYVQN